MNTLDKLLGKVSYIDDFEWPKDPIPWYNSVDINSLYPGIMTAIHAPMLGIIRAQPTDSTMEELE